MAGRGRQEAARARLRRRFGADTDAKLADEAIERTRRAVEQRDFPDEAAAEAIAVNETKQMRDERRDPARHAQRR